MKRIISVVVLILLLAAFTHPRPPLRKNYEQFNKGIAYILVGDKELAVKHLGLFFNEYPDPALKGGFMNLIEANDWEVTKQFKRYLDINHRSVPALVGIALSTSDMKNSTSIDNLKRATRMEPSFSAAHLCLGMEYMKIKNYPQAEAYFTQAIRRSRTPEYKILLSKLYLLLNEPDNVLRLMKPEADRQPDNFYFNFLTAQAYLGLNKLDAMGTYIEGAIEVNPKNGDAQLLLAKYLLNKGNLKRAKSILKTLNFKDYNEDYVKTYAQVLLELKDRKSKNYLDEVYSKNRWDKDINRLMGRYYLWKKGNVRNWIYRSILSGNSISHLQQIFPDGYKFPEYTYLPFFEVIALKWISDEILLVGAHKKSGDKDYLYLIQTKDLKVLNSVGYKGKLQNIFLSKDRKRMLFSTSAGKDEGIYLYAGELSGHRINLQWIYNRPLPMASVVAGFNRAGNLVYITDSDIASRAFESPFAIVSELGEKEPIYPNCPYPIYQYNFAAKSLKRIKDLSQVGTIPIESVRKYLLVYEGYASKSSVQDLIEKGQRLDLTSFSVVKIYFSDDLSAFIIYLSDLKNAFQAVIYDNNANKIFKIDETMFLGAGQYAELKLLNFDPWKKEILLVTKDKNRTLIKFNYSSFLYTRYVDKLIESYYDQKMDIIYALTERSKIGYFTETNLRVISMSPYLSEIVGARRDLNGILYTEGEPNIHFSTFTGELLKMDDQYKFHYLGPSFEGCLNALSPSKDLTAAFINGRLFVMDSHYKSKEN